MTENDSYTWPGKLYEWLHEYEEYGLRSERLLNDIAQGDSKRILEWIKAAYQIGREHENLGWIESHWDDGK